MTEGYKGMTMKSQVFNGGIQRKYAFADGYGASVINHKGSYGYPNKWELAVLKDNDICYDTPITNDVIGHLASDEILPILEKIQAL